jgi:metacaspase-1
MLVSNRFTKSLTRSTRDRLEQMLDNSKPMTTREADHGAVVAVQAALSDLNRGYLAPAEVDGYFGSRTAAAVEMFQRDYGLFADGIVGRQTLTELDQLFSSDLFRVPQGMSIHVGVNVLDENHYGDDTVPLSGCVNDAHDLRDLAVALGYEPILLTDADATTANFTAALRQAATNLFSGDALFVTFSGHGSQVTNNSLDEETDLLDETLCFHDRMLIDDEIYALLSELRPGTHVTMLYDSCHSETVSRVFDPEASFDTEEKKRELKSDLQRQLVPSAPELPLPLPHEVVEEEQEDDDPQRFLPFDPEHLDKALDGDRVDQPEPETLKDDKVDEIVDFVVGVREEIETGKAKRIRWFESPYDKNSDLYDAVKSIVGEHEDRVLECDVVALSACQDNQTTMDGTVNGYFTANVLRTWDGGAFEGSYQQLYSRLASQSVPAITPAINTYSGNRAMARLQERPFAF